MVGGRTALELGGFAHYAFSTGPREVHLYGDEPMPGWLGKLPIETSFVFHSARKLFRAKPISRGLEALKSVMADDEASNPTTIQSSLTWMHLGDGYWPIMLSTPERAVLELLDELPDRETFHQAEMGKRLAEVEKSLAVLKFAVFSEGSIMLALLLKLVFFHR